MAIEGKRAVPRQRAGRPMAINVIEAGSTRVTLSLSEICISSPISGNESFFITSSTEAS